MKNEFVSYEAAMRLKKLGFDEPCLGVFELIVVGDTIPKFRYNWEGEDKWFNHNKEKDEFKDHDWYWSAPTFSQAFRWLREKYLLFGYPFPNDYQKYGYRIVEMSSDGNKELFYDWGTKDTVEEAELSCLDKLIDIIEKKY